MSNHKLRITSLLLIFLASTACGQTASSVDRARKLVESELKAVGRSEDSIWTPIQVRSLLPDESDFFLIPVVRDRKLVSVFRDDPSRSSVKEVISSERPTTLRLELLSPAGVANFVRRKGITAGEPIAVSAGPMSLFGFLGAGWYLPSSGAFYLLSFEGKLLDEGQVAVLWPAKIALFNSLMQPAQDSL